VGLEWGPLSLLSTTEEVLGRNSSGSGLEIREYGRGDPLCRPRDNVNPQNLALTSPTSGGRSVGIVHSRTQTMEFVLFVLICIRIPPGVSLSRLKATALDYPLSAGEVVSLTSRPPYTPRKILGARFCSKLNLPLSHSVAGRIRSLESPIFNQLRCQGKARLSSPIIQGVSKNLYSSKC
jgi:hypothetical protein